MHAFYFHKGAKVLLPTILYKEPTNKRNKNRGKNGFAKGE